MNHAKQQLEEMMKHYASDGNTYFELDHHQIQRLCGLHNLSLAGIERPDWMESLTIADSDQIAAWMMSGDMLKIGELIATRLELYHQKRVEELYNACLPFDDQDKIDATERKLFDRTETRAINRENRR